MRPFLEVTNVERNLKLAINQMSKLTGFDKRAIIKNEAGIILKTVAGRTKMATKDTVDRRLRRKVAREMNLTGNRVKNGGNPVSVNVGMRGREGAVWYAVDAKKGKFLLINSTGRIVGRRIPQNQLRRKELAEINKQTSAYKKQVRALTRQHRASAGLARQSWVQIADDLGIRLENVKGGGLSAAGIAKARRAITSAGKSVKTGQGTEFNNEKIYFVTLINNLSYGRKLRLDRTLENVIAGRVKYFEQNISRGVFKSVENTAKRYPGLFTVAA